MNHGASEEIKIVPAKTLEEIIFENFGFLFDKLKLKKSTEQKIESRKRLNSNSRYNYR